MSGEENNNLNEIKKDYKNFTGEQLVDGLVKNSTAISSLEKDIKTYSSKEKLTLDETEKVKRLQERVTNMKEKVGVVKELLKERGVENYENINDVLDVSSYLKEVENAMIPILKQSSPEKKLEILKRIEPYLKIINDKNKLIPILNFYGEN
jgi:hypothetical protein